MKFIKGTVATSSPDDLSYEQGQLFEQSTWGEAVNCVVEVEGKMYVYGADDCGITQVNFDPFTGKPAKVKRDDYPNKEEAYIREEILRLLSMKENWVSINNYESYNWCFQQNTSGISLDVANILEPWLLF